MSEESQETNSCNKETGTEVLTPSSYDQDSKANITIHLDALSFKSTKTSSSKDKKIKLRKKGKVNEHAIDDKQAVQNEIEIKNLLSDLLDRVEKEESQPKNLVFSTLGTSHEETIQDPEKEEEEVEEGHDNLSAYLESSSDSSREASPEKTPSPFKDFDNYNIDDCHNFNDFCNEVNSVDNDVNDGIKKFKLGRCKVDIERHRLEEEELKIAREYIDSCQDSKQKIDSPRGIAASQKREISRRDNKISDKLREKLRKKRILAAKKLRKSKRCFECDACNKPDCRKCLMCKDMKKYGGKGVKKQSCMMRPDCLFVENNKGTLKSFPTKKLKETRNGSLGKASLSKNKPVQILKKASRISDLKSNKKPTSRSSSLEILKVESRSSKDRQSRLKKRKATESSSGSNLSTQREKLQKFAMVNSDDVMMRKNKIEEIKKKFKQQEEKALATNGKISSMMDLSREELLFGFYL